MDRSLWLILLVLTGLVAALAWPEVRKYRSDPERYRQAMGTGVDIERVVLFPEPRTDFAYEGSPLVAYLAYERRFLDFDDAAVLALADRVAEEVAWKMLLATGSQDVREAERLLWQWGEEHTAGAAGPGSLPNLQARQVMTWVAEELIRENLYYGEEALFSRSFDPAAQRRGAGHLDCDQLSHVFLHVAWRLDLDVREVLSPLHVYLAYVGPPEVAGSEIIVEATAFRSSRTADGGFGTSYAVGEGFFMHPDELARYGHVRASPRLQAAAGYFSFATDRDIADGIVSEVMRGLAEERGLTTLDPPEPADRDSRWRDAELVMAELAAAADGTRKPSVVSNLYLAHWRAFRWALGEGELDRARRHAEALAGLRAERGALVIEGEPYERIAAARLALARGERREALVALRALYEEYGGEATARRGTAWSDGHAEVLLGLALLGEGGGATARYERFLGPVLAFEQRVFPGGDARRAALAARLCAEQLQRIDARVAATCRARAG